MKKNYLFLLILTFFCFINSNAQSSLSFGQSMVITTITYYGYENNFTQKYSHYSPAMSYSFRQKINKNLFLQTGVQAQMKGITTTSLNADCGNSPMFVGKLYHLSVPLQIGFNIKKWDFYGGGTASRKITERWFVDWSFVEGIGKRPNLEKLDAATSIVAGKNYYFTADAGIRFRCNKMLFFSLDVSKGFADIKTENTILNSAALPKTNDKHTPLTLQISSGISF
jgi:hypothetical protein